MPDVFRRSRPLFVLLAAVVLLTSCVQQQPKSFDDAKAKENFVNACTTERLVVEDDNGDTRVEEEDLAPLTECNCIYEQISETMKFSELQDYEKELAKVGDGEEVPTPPPALVTAIESCQVAGPAR